MTVVIPWTKKDVEYLANEGLRDISTRIRGNRPLQAKYQRMANAVKDFNGNKFAKQELIDTYYDIVNCITKNSLEEWQEYEKEHARQLSKEQAQDIRKNQETLLSQLYCNLEDRTNLVNGIEEEMSKKLPDNRFVGELFASWGLEPSNVLMYSIERITSESFLEIDKIAGEMQNHIEGDKGYSGEHLFYLNQIVEKIKNIKKDSSLPGVTMKYGPEIEEKLSRAYEIGALYGAKFLEAISKDRPIKISKDEIKSGFNQIKNIAYKNAIHIPSKELSAEMIKNILDVEDKYQNKIQTFSRRYLLKKQDQLFDRAKNAAENRNHFVFSTHREVKEIDLLGNVFSEEKINIKNQPIFLDNSLQYARYKGAFENISRNYSEVLEEESESLEGALNKLDGVYADSRNVGIKKYLVKNGKIFSEEELEEIYGIYSKLINQCAEKLKESLKRKDTKKIKEYIDLTKSLLKERTEEVGSLVKPIKTNKLGLETRVVTLENDSKLKNEMPLMPYVKNLKPSPSDRNLGIISKETQTHSDSYVPRHMQPESIKRRAELKAENEKIKPIYDKYQKGMIIHYNHNLTSEEAYQCTTNLLSDLQKEHSKDIRDTMVSWNKDKSKMNFSLKVKGILVEGEMHLIGNQVVLGGKLDWRAKPFKSLIEKAIMKKLEETFI